MQSYNGLVKYTHKNIPFLEPAGAHCDISVLASYCKLFSDVKTVSFWPRHDSFFSGGLCTFSPATSGSYKSFIIGMHFVKSISFLVIAVANIVTAFLIVS